MTTEIPHSLDAVIIALQAVIDGRPLPADWQTARDAASPPPAAPVFDDAKFIEGLATLIDEKIASLPKPDAVAIPYPVENSVPDLTQPLTELGLYVVAIQEGQKAEYGRVDAMNARLEVVECILQGLAVAVHKDES
jgi:hypothetical protein